MPFLTVRGVRIYYEMHGEGETLILLHHGFGCTKIWSVIAPALVQAGYRVLAYDRRGHGRSEKGPGFEEFYVSERFRPESLEELRLVKESLGITSCHLVGQCEGGVIAIDYALKFPGEVQTIVTSSTQCYSEVPMREFNISRVPKTFQELDIELKVKLIDWHGREHAESYYNQFRLFGGAYGKEVFDLRPLLSSVVCPVLIIYPDRSSIFDVEQGVAFYRHLAKGELMVLPACGHNTYELYPEDYVRAIVRFHERLRSPVTRSGGISCVA